MHEGKVAVFEKSVSSLRLILSPALSTKWAHPMQNTTEV